MEPVYPVYFYTYGTIHQYLGTSGLHGYLYYSGLPLVWTALWKDVDEARRHTDARRETGYSHDA